MIDWFPMDRLGISKIAVIGAGAVGNEVIKNLALLGVAEIHIYDFDSIEEHNLTRSVLFRPSDVGAAKAAVAARRAVELDPNIKAVGYVGDFWKLLRFDDIASLDALICCVDNFEARIRANKLCALVQKDFVSVGVDSRFCSVEAYPFSEGEGVACYECNLPASVYARMSKRYSCGHLRKISFIERKIPTTIITSSAAGAMATSWALRMQDRFLPGSIRYLQDTIAGTTSVATLPRAKACPGCSPVSGPIAVCTSSRRIGQDWPSGLAADVILSEPILLSYQVRNKKPVVVFRSSAEFDDTFPSEVGATADTIRLDVRDHISMQELTTKYRALEIPAKFAIVTADKRKVVLEFE